MFKISVDGLVFIVTGANRKNGIGRALVEEAIKRGAKKVYATARNISQLDDLVAKFQGKVVPIELDVTNLEHIQKTAQRASDTQVLINNAGVSGFSGCIYNYDEKSAHQEMEVNYFGPLRLMNAFAKKLIKNGNGAIVNIIYNFGNNARKFLEIYLYYKYPNGIDGDKQLLKFFGEESIPAILTERVNNEYSHLCGGFERGASPIEVPEMKIVAQQIVSKIKEKDPDQYSALLQSIGVTEKSIEEPKTSMEAQ